MSREWWVDRKQTLTFTQSLTCTAVRPPPPPPHLPRLTLFTERMYPSRHCGRTSVITEASLLLCALHPPLWCWARVCVWRGGDNLKGLQTWHHASGDTKMSLRRRKPLAGSQDHQCPSSLCCVTQDLAVLNFFSDLKLLYLKTVISARKSKLFRCSSGVRRSVAGVHSASLSLATSRNAKVQSVA
jgi:hypothetical protein